jgi:hypothetical protein
MGFTRQTSVTIPPRTETWSFAATAATSSCADAIPEGFHIVEDNFPTAGHVTLCTTRPQKGVVVTSVTGMGAQCVSSPLPWKLAGYVMCPGAAPSPHATGDTNGECLITNMCEHQSMLSLEQLESLRMLVAAPVYTIDALATILPPAAALDLPESARRSERPG